MAARLQVTFFWYRRLCFYCINQVVIMLTRFFYMKKPERSVSKQGQLQPHCHSKTRPPSNLVSGAFSLAWLVTEQTTVTNIDGTITMERYTKSAFVENNLWKTSNNLLQKKVNLSKTRSLGPKYDFKATITRRHIESHNGSPCRSVIITFSSC